MNDIARGAGRPQVSLESLVDAFEQAWDGGSPPEIDAFLALCADDQRGSVLVELVHVDLECRLKNGEAAGAEDYLRRYPQLSDNPEVVAELRRAERRLRIRRLGEPAAAAEAPPPAERPRSAGSRLARFISVARPQIDGYAMVRELGRGGMGVVYLARQTALNRPVAIKMILSGGYSNPEIRARFFAEAEAVARLRHPSIIQVYEVGEAQGSPFFSMEFVEGGSLADQLESALLAPAKAASLVAALARAMHHAHGQGIIHRDLKPANVLLTADGTPKVTDFGLAKCLDSAGHSVSGDLIGTPSYMAPEQAAGEIRRIGPATDVYALATILYEALTGRPPFKGATVLETLEQVREREPVAPRQLQPNVPRDLETICLKGMRKDPVQRYATALALAEDLERYLDGRPVLARPVSASERALKWVRRRPTQAALLAAVACLVVSVPAGALFYARFKGQEAAALRQQIEHRDHFDGLLRLAQGAEDAGHLADAKQALDQALATLDADGAAGSDDLRAQVEGRRDHIGRLLQEQIDRQAALDRLTRFRKGKDDVQFRAVNPQRADAAADWPAVRELAPAALAEIGLRVGDDPAGDALDLSSYGPYLGESGPAALAAGCVPVLLLWADAEAARTDDRAAGQQRALRLLDAAAALGDAHQLPRPRALHLRRADYLTALGDGAGAAAERELAARLEPHAAADHFLAALHAYLHGDADRAADAAEAALRQEPDHFWAQYLKALCDLKGRRWDSAAAGFTACLARRPDFFWARLHLAMANGQRGALAAAEADFAQALRQAPDPPARWNALMSRGALLVRARRWDDAVAALEQAVRERPEAPEGHAGLALAYQGREDWDAARAALDRAVERRAGDPGLYHTRALLHLARGDKGAARADFERAIARSPEDGGERLASDHVELAHLQHQAREHTAALAGCDAALRARPDYPPAHRQRAETLLALCRYAEAGRALDRYLVKGAPSPEVHQARGLIHAHLREYPEAVEAYTRSLILKPDAATLSYRGWAYLKLDAARPALADFEAALRLAPAHGDALCGRGHAHVRLGQVAEALDDAAAALRHLPAGAPQRARSLFSVACLQARAAALLDDRANSRAEREQAVRCELRAVESLRAALGQLPVGEREAFWRDTILNERDLATLRRAGQLTELATLVNR